MSTTKEICGNCKYYEKHNHCKKHAPILMIKEYPSTQYQDSWTAKTNEYPWVAEDNFCGDFENKPS